VDGKSRQSKLVAASPPNPNYGWARTRLWHHHLILTTKYRDLHFLVQFGVQLMMYALPVVYPVSSIHEKFLWIILANPMTSIVETFRYAFHSAGTESWNQLPYSYGFMLVVVFLGSIIFNCAEQTLRTDPS